MAKRSSDDMIHCAVCGEDYSATYKKCPFCAERARTQRQRRGEDERDEYYDDDYDDDEDEPTVRSRGSGGKRLVGGGGGRRGGGYREGPGAMKILGTVVSLLLIVAAIFILINIIRPLVSRGKPTPTPSPTPTAAATPTPPATPVPTAPPDVTPAPTDPGEHIPSTQTAERFTISGNGDITLDKIWPSYTFTVTFYPAGSTGEITWTSSKSDVISVDSNGRVSGLKVGSATVTATMAGGYTQTCIVRSTVSSGSTAVATDPSGTSATLKLNHDDFTFSSLNDAPVQMRVTGATGTPVWSVSDTGVATISESGVVRPAGKGVANIICTVDGQTLKCIVRGTW